MNARRIARTVAACVPAHLRRLRGRLMLEGEATFLGVEELRCPACRGQGWLNRRRLEACTLCCGFGEVPDGLAEWYRAQSSYVRRREQAAGGAARRGLAKATAGQDE